MCEQLSALVGPGAVPESGVNGYFVAQVGRLQVFSRLHVIEPILALRGVFTADLASIKSVYKID